MAFHPVPFFIGILVLIIAGEQILLIQPVLGIFRITRDYSLMMLIAPFLLILIGALASVYLSSLAAFMSYFTALDVLVTSTAIRTLFEGLAFAILSVTSLRWKISLCLVLPLTTIMGINYFSIAMFAIFLLTTIIRFSKSKEKEGDRTTLIVITIGSCLLIASKVMLIIPAEFWSIFAREFVSALMETFGLSNFLIIREMIAFGGSKST